MNVKSIIGVIVLIVIVGGGYYWYQGNSSDSSAASDLEINFGNNSWDALKSIELSAAGQNTFQAIPLENSTLGAGEFFKYAIPDGQTVCKYDLRITKEGGEVSDRPNVDLCSATFYHFEEDS